MTPFYTDDWLTLYGGDCLDVMREMPADSVDCVVTSPPYWGLRDYNSPGQLGLERTPEEYVANMVNVFREVRRVLKPHGTVFLNLGDSYASASSVEMRRVRKHRAEGESEGPVPPVLSQGVQEPTGVPDARADRAASSVQRDVPPEAQGDEEPGDHRTETRTAASSGGDAGREVRVLSGDDSGLPDTGSRPERRSSGAASATPPDLQDGRSRGLSEGSVPDPLLELQRGEGDAGSLPTFGSLKQKDLVGIPWMVAFALRADGWYLRSDIIWSKPNPMPESVTDRPTKSHEYLFLLTKSPRYYFDADAVREPHKWQDEAELAVNAQARQQRRLADRIAAGDMTAVRTSDVWRAAMAGEREKGRYNGVGTEADFTSNPAGRNIRSVWNIATRPYPGAHFAVFPPELPERCIKAGSSEKGVCPECGAPWERVVERGKPFDPKQYAHRFTKDSKDATGRNDVGGTVDKSNGQEWAKWKAANPDKVLGWSSTCQHEVDDVRPAVILDPFGGSGTVGMVANRLSRRAILIDLNPSYLRQQMERNAQTPLGLSEGDAA